MWKDCSRRLTLDIWPYKIQSISYGQAGSAAALKKHCKGATVGKGLAIHGADAAKSESKVAAWAKKELG